MNKKLFLLSVIPISLCPISSFAGPFTDINRLGDLFMVMTPAYALGMTVQAKDFKGTLQLAENIATVQIATEGLKRIVREERPNGADNLSFPSGHSAGAFSGAMFVHKRYGLKPALLPYAMAAITGWTRVYVKAHYWHDVIAGAALSALFTWVIVEPYDTKISVSADTSGFNFSFKTSFKTVF